MGNQSRISEVGSSSEASNKFFLIHFVPFLLQLILD